MKSKTVRIMAIVCSVLLGMLTIWYIVYFAKEFTLYTNDGMSLFIPILLYRLITEFILLILAIIILFLLSSFLKKQEGTMEQLGIKDEHYNNGTYYHDISAITDKTWTCSNCGKENPKSLICCSDCGEYK